MADSAPWLVLVDAIIEIARALLPEAWLRYCAIAVELERIASPEEAARHRLLRPRSVKLAEAADWDRLGQGLMPGRYRSTTTPAEARRIRLAQESLELERQFQDALLGELRAGRWAGESISERDGRAWPIALTVWFVAGLVFDPPNNAIQPGGAPRLLGVQLRPVEVPEEAQQSAETVTHRDTPRHSATADGSPAPAQPDEDAPLSRAGLSEIRLALDELYDQTVIAAGYKPPNLREAGWRGQRLLAERDRYATASRVEEVDRAPRYTERRLKRGDHFKR